MKILPNHMTSHSPKPCCRIPAMLLAVALGHSAVQATSVDPSIDGSVNGVRTIQLFQGWPLLVQVTLFHPQIFDSTAFPLTITPDAGHWSDLLNLQVYDSSGASVSWPLTLLNSPGPSMTLDGHTIGQLTWALTPDQTSLIQTDAYQITVTLDTSSVSNQSCWKGTLSCVPMDIQLGTEPDQLTAMQTESKHTTFAQYYDALGNSQEALHQIDLLLLSDSNNIGGLSFRASLLADLNQNRDALSAVNQALSQVYLQFTNPPEAPQELIRLQGDLMRKLAPGRFNAVTVTNNTIYLEWNVNPGHTYTLEQSLDLRNWTPLATGLTTPDNILSWTTNRIETRQFFRIR